MTRKEAKPAPVRLEATPPGPYAVKVEPAVLAAAREVARPGQSIVVVSSTEVRVVNDPEG